MQETNETNNNNIKLLVSSEVFFIIIILSVFLFKRILDLRRASSRIDDLEKILPICSNCKKIRINDDAPKDINSWVTVEQYYHEKDETSFTHGICPECVKKLYPDVYKKIK